MPLLTFAILALISRCVGFSFVLEMLAIFQLYDGTLVFIGTTRVKMTLNATLILLRL